MIVLDTNVVSELLAPRPDPGVLAWVDARPSGDLAVTAVTAGELRYGVARLDPGRWAVELGQAVEQVITIDFAGRVLAYDAIASEHLAHIVAQRERSGHPIGFADAQIAAICRSHGAAVATRDGGGFADTGVVVIDPWSSIPNA